jgi:Tol biopolymer transport system component
MTITDKGIERDVTEGEGAVWLPDRAAIAFMRVAYVNPSPITSVWTARPDGSEVHEILVVPPPKQVTFITAAHHPARIIFVADARVWQMRPDGSDVTELFQAEASQVAVSPDGSKIAYVTSELNRPSSLKVVDMSGRSLGVAFAGTAHACGLNNPSWSPDGRWLAFGLCVDKGGFQLANGIWLVHPSGTNLHRLAREGATPSWSPDGQWITYITSHMNSAHNDELVALVKRRSDGGGFGRITQFTPSSAPPGQPAPPENPRW